MKARVTIEFDLDGLGAYDDLNDPACHQNLRDMFHRMKYSLLEDNMRNIPAKDSIMEIAVQKAYDEDMELVQRILKGIKIEEIK